MTDAEQTAQGHRFDEVDMPEVPEFDGASFTRVPPDCPNCQIQSREKHSDRHWLCLNSGCLVAVFRGEEDD